MKKLVTSAFIALTLLSISAQNGFEAVKNIKRSSLKKSLKKSNIHFGEMNKVDPMYNLSKISVSKPMLENDSAYHAELKILNEERRKIKAITENRSTISDSNYLRIDTSFKGNSWGGGTPPDNSIAVSKDGYIVSAVNSNIRIFDTSGTMLKSRSLSLFGRDVLGFSQSNEFDPRVIYDPVADRFIVIFLSGSDPSYSRIVIGFSRSRDPLADWNLYALDGNVTDEDVWFDFPTVGISSEGLFIGGNLFSSEGHAYGAAVFQIDKQTGYDGEDELSYITWSNIYNQDGVSAFTMVPLSHGYDAEYGPGIYLATTYSSYSSSTEIPIYHIEGSMYDNPTMTVKHYESERYRRNSDADQPNSTFSISVGDLRMQHGMYIDSMLHFVFTSRYTSGYAGINYMRIALDEDTTTTTLIGKVGKDYAFPSIASIGCNEEHQAVAISFLSTSIDQYPSAELVAITEDLVVSDPIMLKEGEGTVDLMVDEADRWGDYSGTVREWNGHKPKIWSGICYGSSASTQHLDTYIAATEINQDCRIYNGIEDASKRPPVEFKIYPNPVFEMMSIEFNMENSQMVSIELYSIDGRKVGTMLYDRVKTGTNVFSFNKKAFPKGQYIVKIQTEKGMISSKNILIQ